MSEKDPGVEVAYSNLLGTCRLQKDTITRLTAEVEQNAIDLEEYRRDVERLRAALVRWLDAINDKRAFEHHHPDDLGKEWSRLREAVDLAEDNARAALSGDKHE
jgi:hypothetical protein